VVVVVCLGGVVVKHVGVLLVAIKIVNNISRVLKETRKKHTWGSRHRISSPYCYECYFSSFLLLQHALALCLSFYLSKHEFTCRST
jgi:hypothetical protein